MARRLSTASGVVIGFPLVLCGFQKRRAQTWPGMGDCAPPKSIVSANSPEAFGHGPRVADALLLKERPEQFLAHSMLDLVARDDGRRQLRDVTEGHGVEVARLPGAGAVSTKANVRRD